MAQHCAHLTLCRYAQPIHRRETFAEPLQQFPLPGMIDRRSKLPDLTKKIIPCTALSSPGQPFPELPQQNQTLLRRAGFHIRDGIRRPCQQITHTQSPPHRCWQEAQAEVKRARHRR